VIRQLAMSESIRTAHTGAFCPYWTELDGRVFIADTAEEMFDFLPHGRRTVDSVSVLAFLQFNHMLGDRTLVEGVRRMPWRGELLGTGELRRLPAHPHGRAQMPAKKIARQMIRYLQEELTEVTRGHARAMLMLSGGLDSRILAGVLKSIESSCDARVEVLTWGIAGSRDRNYAARIAEHLGWKQNVLDYTPELAWRNVRTAAEWGGSECAGIHLHGLDWFRQNAKPDDIVIAGTLGDSIGRAVYYGRHIGRVLRWPIVNTRSLFPYTRFLSHARDARLSRRTAWADGKSESRIAKLELHLQENFLRRMLCHAMDYPRQFCDVHQAFSSDALVRLVWGLDPRVRTDAPYEEALMMLDPALARVPWARTGRPLGSIEPPDELAREHHNWWRWAKGPFADALRDLIRSPGLEALGLFHGPSLERMWDEFEQEGAPHNRLIEDVIKVCTIELARARFGLRSSRTMTPLERSAESVLRAGLRLAQPVFCAWQAAKEEARKHW